MQNVPQNLRWVRRRSAPRAPWHSIWPERRGRRWTSGKTAQRLAPGWFAGAAPESKPLGAIKLEVHFLETQSFWVEIKMPVQSAPRRG